MFKTVLACIGGIWIVINVGKVFAKITRNRLEAEFAEKERELRRQYKTAAGETPAAT